MTLNCQPIPTLALPLPLKGGEFLINCEAMR